MKGEMGKMARALIRVERKINIEKTIYLKYL